MSIKSSTKKYWHFDNFSIVLGSLSIAGSVWLGFTFVKNLPAVTIANSRYENYNQECSVFLGKAANAGTTEVAKEEVAKAVNWLLENYSAKSFEYRNLKANLEYLEQQPKHSLLTSTSKELINQSSNALEEEELKKLYKSPPLLSFILALTSLLLLGVVAIRHGIILHELLDN